jgi:HD-GYP domain-containing protein (c-di-GMP phosphodiesterase class II)
MSGQLAAKLWGHVMPEKPQQKVVTAQTVDPLLGQRFLQVLNSLFSTAKIHLDNNKLLQNSVDNFAKIIEEFLQFDDEINLLASVGCFYLQQEKVALQRSASGLARKMLAYFEKRQLEGLRFKRSTGYVSHDDILAFVRLLNQAENEKEPAFWLQSMLEEKGYYWVEIIDTAQAQSLAAIFMNEEETTASTKTNKPEQRDPDTSPAAPEKGQAQTKTTRIEDRAHNGHNKQQEKKSASARKRKRQRRTRKAMLTYSYAMHSLQEVADRLTTNKNASLGKSVQLVQSMVDLVMNDDNVLLDLSTIRDYDDYTFTHSINVSILSLCLGHRIDLSKLSLSRLGLSALFHDLGKIDIPKEIINKPGKLTKKEYIAVKAHSMNSVRRILKLRASYDRKAGILLAPFEHHLRYDLSGYPKTPRKKPISLFGCIITIADFYDAITAPRIYRKSYMSPDKALGLMLKDSGTMFDPILLKVFINMLGVYPIGTVLVFNDTELGLVAHAPDEDVDPGALWALLLEKNENGGFRKGSYINLGMWDPDVGTFNRPIQKTLHPADLGIQPAEFLLF